MKTNFACHGKQGRYGLLNYKFLGHVKEKTTNSRNNGVCSHLRQVKAGRGIASPNLFAAVLQFFFNSRIYIHSLLLIKDFKKQLILKSITDLCYSSSVIKNFKILRASKKEKNIVYTN